MPKVAANTAATQSPSPPRETPRLATAACQDKRSRRNWLRGRREARRRRCETLDRRKPRRSEMNVLQMAHISRLRFRGFECRPNAKSPFLTTPCRKVRPFAALADTRTTSRLRSNYFYFLFSPSPLSFTSCRTPRRNAARPLAAGNRAHRNCR